MKNSPVSQSSSGLGFAGRQRRQSSSGTSLASSHRITKQLPSRMTDASTSEDGRHRMDGEDTDSDAPSFYEDHEPLPRSSAPPQQQQLNRQPSSTQFSRLASDASVFGSQRPSLANGRPGNEYRMVSSRSSLGIAHIPAVVTPTRVPMRKNKAGATRPTSSQQQQQQQKFERLHSERDQPPGFKEQTRSVGSPMNVSARNTHEQVTSSESSSSTRIVREQSAASAHIPEVETVGRTTTEQHKTNGTQRNGQSSPDSSRAESCSKSISTNSSFKGNPRARQHGVSESVPVACWVSQKPPMDAALSSPVQLASSATISSPQNTHSPILPRQTKVQTPNFSSQLPKRPPPALPDWSQSRHDDNNAAGSTKNGGQPTSQLNTARPSHNDKSRSPSQQQNSPPTDRIRMQVRRPHEMENSDWDSRSSSSTLQSIVVIPEKGATPEAKPARRSESGEDVKFEICGEPSSREKSMSMESNGKRMIVHSLTPTRPTKEEPSGGRGRRSIDVDKKRTQGNTIQLSGRTIAGVRQFKVLDIPDSDSDSDLESLDDDDSDKTTSFAEEPESSPAAGGSRSPTSQRSTSPAAVTDAPQLVPTQGSSDVVARLRPVPLRHAESTTHSGSQWSKTTEAGTPEVVDLGRNPPSLNSSLPSYTQSRAPPQKEAVHSSVRGTSPIKINGEPCPALRTARDKTSGSSSAGVAASVDTWGPRRAPTKAAETARSLGTTSSQNPMRVVLKTHRAFEGLSSSTALPSSTTTSAARDMQNDVSTRTVTSVGSGGSNGVDPLREPNGIVRASSRNPIPTKNSFAKGSQSCENVGITNGSMRESTRLERSAEGSHSIAAPADDVLMDTIGSSSGRQLSPSVLNMSLSSANTTPTQPPLPSAQKSPGSLAGSQRVPGEQSTSAPQAGLARSGGPTRGTSQPDQVMYRLSLSGGTPEMRSRRESAEVATLLAPPIPLPPSTAHMVGPQARSRHGASGSSSNQPSFCSPTVVATAPPETPASPRGNASLDRTTELDMSPRRNGGAFTNVAFQQQQRNAQQRVNAEGQVLSNASLQYQASDSNSMLAPIEEHETPKKRTKNAAEASGVKYDSLTGSRSQASFEGSADLTSTVVRVRKIFSADSRPPQEAVVEEEELCCICLEPYSKDNPMMRVGCVHHFHAPCLMGWKQRSNLCPMCMTETIGEQTAQAKPKKADEEEDSDYNYARRLQEQFTREVADARTQRQRQQQQQQSTQNRVRPETPSLPPRRVSAVAAHISTSGHGRTESPMLPRHRARPSDIATRPQTAQSASTVSRGSAGPVASRPVARVPESRRQSASRTAAPVSTRPTLISATAGSGHHNTPTTAPSTAAIPNARGAPANGVRTGIPTTTATKHHGAREERSRSIFGAISNIFGGAKSTKKK